MSDAGATLTHQIDSATDLQSVVRTMRALAASSIHQYEQSVLALSDYWQALNLGLGACLRLSGTPITVPPQHGAAAASVGAIVFGSDQGLVGQFNDVIVAHALQALRAMPGQPVVWAVGERIRARLSDAGITVAGTYAQPSAVEAIAPLIEQLQFDTETHPSQQGSPRICIFFNQPKPGALYEPVTQRLLPLDDAWRAHWLAQAWPTRARPEVIGNAALTLKALIHEHLFIALYRACAESLASENTSRLAAMERADKNIDELLVRLGATYRSERQRAIDEELFDVVAGADQTLSLPAAAAPPAPPHAARSAAMLESKPNAAT